MPSNLQRGIKNSKRELRKSTETFKLILTTQLQFFEYETKLYNEVPKPLCEVNNHTEMIV